MASPIPASVINVEEPTMTIAQPPVEPALLYPRR